MFVEGEESYLQRIYPMINPIHRERRYLLKCTGTRKKREREESNLALIGSFQFIAYFINLFLDEAIPEDIQTSDASPAY